jgi:hypothetical protein
MQVTFWKCHEAGPKEVLQQVSETYHFTALLFVLNTMHHTWILRPSYNPRHTSRCNESAPHNVVHNIPNGVLYSLLKLVAADLGYHNRYSDWLRTGRPRARSSSAGRGNIFLLSTSSRPILGPTLPPIQWVPMALSSGVKRPGREAGHHLQLMTMSRIRGCTRTYPFLHTSSWHSD